MRQEMSTEKIQTFEKEIGYTFKDKQLLMHALSHSSYANERGMDKSQSNERLEFLGDAIVDMVAGDCLFHMMPDSQEGVLTKTRASVVCEQSFAKLASEMHFGDYILLGKGEEATGGRTRASVLADCFEAVIAAIYLDSDFDTVYAWIKEHLQVQLALASSGQATKDYKTVLQEKTQKGQFGKVTYRLTGEEGPDHAKVFTVQVFVDNVYLAEGKGTSKKDAEQAAAGVGLKKLGHA